MFLYEGSSAKSHTQKRRVITLILLHVMTYPWFHSIINSLHVGEDVSIIPTGICSVSKGASAKGTLGKGLEIL